MAVMHFRGSHIKLIATYYGRNLIRGGMGIMFTLVALTAGLLIAAAFITPVEALQKSIEEGRGGRFDRPGRGKGPNDFGPVDREKPGKKEIVEEVTKQIGVPVVEWWTGDNELASFLVHDRPALVSAILIVMLFFLPFIVGLGAFNQLSGDIQYKGLRYLLLRTERANIFLGRFIGTVIFTMIVWAIVLAIVFLYLVFKADFYPAGTVFLWMLQGYVAMILLSLPYIALCAWMSAVLDQPFGTLAICQLLMIFPPVFVALAKQIEPNLACIGWVLPWAFKYTLLHPNILYFLGAALYMLVQTAFFMFLGLRHFQTRDL